MKKNTLFLSFLWLFLAKIALSQDAPNCKEHPMFPTRMPNFILSECVNNYNSTDFKLVSDGSKMITKEGNTSVLRYDFNTESGQQKPSPLQILKNYENASRKIGGVTMYQNGIDAVGVYKILKNGKEIVWVKVESGGDNSNDFYYLYIVELEEMTQDITSNDILTALNAEGHISLYINFETGKSDIKAESEKTIDQVAEMLNANPTIKISIEGHTDNEGSSTTNKALSENRAKAVMNALTLKGIDKTRLSSKGWGQDKPIADNTTEEGKAKNRRVEIVKM